jgi:pre-mRNA-processing factor 39
LAYVSADYQAHIVWEKYLAFEQEHGTTQHVASLYPRMLACPMKEIEKLYKSFQQYVGPRTVQELLSEDQVAALRDSLLPTKQQQQEEFAAAAAAAKQAAAAAVAAEAAAKTEEEPAVKTEAEEGEGGTAEADTAAATEEGKDTEMADALPTADGEEGEAAALEGEAAGADPSAAAAGDASEAPPTTTPEEAAAAPADNEVKPAAGEDAAADRAADSAVPVKEEAPPAAAAAMEPSPMEVQVTVSDEEVKAAWVGQCSAIYEATHTQLLPPRQPFEAGIRRPYYHVKPLDPAQLKNWVAYLTWSEGQGDVAGSIHLYERCLVACANYPGEGRQNLGY